MIGNKIKFRLSEFIGSKYETNEFEGIVVDAFTDVSGFFQSSSFLGFGEGNGKTNSNRMYKVEFLRYGHSKWYVDIYSHQLIEILEYNFINQEEKFVKNNE